MPAAPPEPIGDGEAERLFAPLASAGGIVLAVSGGADSLALLVLADRWRRTSPRLPVVVATVDHGLRAEAIGEAAMVAALCARLGLPHRTLRWDGPKPGTGIEAAARDARYRLVRAFAITVGADRVVTAHHQDDQAETVLMRLGRGSGLAGLSGMPAARRLGPGVMLVRPFLGVAKARLVATVAAAGLTPAIDASNADPRFTRARLRKALPVLAAEGIDAAGIARTAALLRRANDALEEAATELLRRSARVDALAIVRLDPVLLAAAPEEIRLRVLARLIQTIAGSDWPPRLEQVEALAAVLAAAGPFKRTIGGVAIRARVGIIELFREAGRRPPADVVLAPGHAGTWDGRFAITVGDLDGGALTLGPLGEAGRREAGVTGHGSAAALAMLPAFRLDGRLVAVPPLGFRREGGKGLKLLAECSLGAVLGIPAGTFEGPLTRPA